MPQAWFVYLLECKGHSLYTGVTNDVMRRFGEHQQRTAHYTSYNPPLRIAYAEPCSTKSEALRREAQIKGWTRRRKLLS